MNFQSDLSNKLTPIIDGRTIAIVGNASSILKTRHGAQIDECCVVRLNSGVPIRARAQGRRIDIHCISTPSSFDVNMKKARWLIRFRRGYFAGATSIWTGKEEREDAASDQMFYPVEMLDYLTSQFGAKPSVGARALHIFSELTEAPIKLFGFDFKESESFYRKRENRGPHNWDAERDYARGLARVGRIEIRP
jgi:hypothetical protein